MPFVRLGDTSATHPLLMAIADVPGADSRSTLEVFGFVCAASTMSAAHLTDYEVSAGTARMLAGNRAKVLLEQAVRAGLMKRRTRAGVHRYFIVDDPELIHLRLREDVEWERQRKADTTDPKLIGPVRVRDGDQCRYCAVVVYFGQRKGPRRGTYDHVAPGERARDTAGLVVCCGACNGRRSNDPDANEKYPLLPVPSEPLYLPATVRFLADRGYTVTPGAAPQPPADASDPTHQENATPPREDLRPDNQSESARPHARDAQRPTAPDTATSTTATRKRSRRGRSSGSQPEGGARAPT